jgi:hypothetical protein
MERLESETRPVLTPMLNDEVVSLSHSAQTTLARWITLRVLTAQYAHPGGKRIIASGTHSRFYHARELPRGAQIWIGRYNGAGAWPTQYHHVELYASADGVPEPLDPDVFMITCSVGYVVFAYWGHEIHSFGPAVDASVLAEYLTPIWPVTESVVEWPPRGLIGKNGVAEILRRFPID